MNRFLSGRCRPRGCPSTSERGFVLVGVVVFVLALTILGLSLFNLSSFEAQFLSHSTRETQALYDAMSGIEWAKMVLEKEKRLQAVQDGAPAAVAGTRPARVVSVEASQGSNNTGSIDYSSEQPILIRALADDGRGVRRMVECAFKPKSPSGLYHNLVDSYTYLQVDLGVPPRLRDTDLFGSIRVNDLGNSANWDFSLYTGNGVPLPQVLAFFDADGRLANATRHVGSGPHFDFFGSDDAVTYVTPLTPRVFENDTMSVLLLAADNPLLQDHVLRVTGNCVWLLPMGIRVDRRVRVEAGSPGARLVIVARPMRGKQSANSLARLNGHKTGVYFLSGIDSPEVPVVIVSDAQVAITHADLIDRSSSVPALSIFAERVSLQGPEDNAQTGEDSRMVLVHPESMAFDILELGSLGGLPNIATSSTSAFSTIPGTWRELDPDNPS